MRRFSIVAMSLLLAGSAFADPQQHSKRKGPPFTKKGPGGPPFPEMVERFNSLSPAERSEALRKLPPERRRMMERRLEEWANTSPEERRRLQGSYARFQGMNPERQREVRQLFRQFGEAFPGERRPEAMRTVRRLKQADADERKKILESTRYTENFNEEERRLIERMVEELPNRD